MYMFNRYRKKPSEEESQEETECDPAPLPFAWMPKYQAASKNLWWEKEAGVMSVTTD